MFLGEAPKVARKVARVDLTEPGNEVQTWLEFFERYKELIENLEIQLERGENYKKYKELVDTWKDLGIESWFLVREILHRKNCILIENDFPPVGLPEGVKVYTFWINTPRLEEQERSVDSYRRMLRQELLAEGYDIDQCICYMRDQSQMSIPQFPHFHVYCPPKTTPISSSPSP